MQASVSTLKFQTTVETPTEWHFKNTNAVAPPLLYNMTPSKYKAVCSH